MMNSKSYYQNSFLSLPSNTGREEHWIRRCFFRLLRFREVILYCLIGCTGATLDFVVYALLISCVGFHYQVANFLSVSFGIVNNFFLNFYFNFKVKSSLLLRLCSFYIIGMLGWGISAGCLWLLIDKVGLNSLLAKLATIGIVTVVQFCLNKCITFKK